MKWFPFLGLLLATAAQAAQWERLPLPRHEARTVLASASHQGTLISYDSQSLFLSPDSGVTWEQHPLPNAARIGSSENPITAVAALWDPQGQITLFAASLHRAEIYRSGDLGLSWTLTSQTTNAPRRTLLLGDPHRPDVLIAAGEDEIFESDDHGETWVSVASGLDGQWAAQIAIDPDMPMDWWTLTTGGDVFRSDDGGRNWTATAIPSLSGRVRIALGDTVDARRVIYMRNRGRMYRLLDGQPTLKFLTTLPDGGPSQHHTDFLIADPNRPGFVSAGTRLGIMESDDYGETFVLRDHPALAGNVEGHWIAPWNSDLRITIGRHFSRSEDNGITWFPTGGNLSGVHRAVLATHRDLRDGLLAASEHELFESFDVGQSWQVRSAQLPNYIDRLFGFPHAGDRLLATPSGGSVLYQSMDGGINWDILANRAIVGDDFSVHSLIHSPLRPGFLLAGGFGHVWVSEDDGLNWQNVYTFSDPWRIEQVAISPIDPFTIYLAHRENLIRSDDGGFSWQPLSMPTPATDIKSVAVDHFDPNRLYVSTAPSPVHNPFLVSGDRGQTWSHRGRLYELYSQLLPDHRQHDTVHLIHEGRGFTVTEDAGFSLRLLNIFEPGLPGKHLHRSTPDSGILLWESDDDGIYLGREDLLFTEGLERWQPL